MNSGTPTAVLLPALLFCCSLTTCLLVFVPVVVLAQPVESIPSALDKPREPEALGELDPEDKAVWTATTPSEDVTPALDVMLSGERRTASITYMVFSLCSFLLTSKKGTYVHDSVLKGNI